MSVMWLVLPLAATGLGEAMHFAAQVALLLPGVPDIIVEHGHWDGCVAHCHRVLYEHDGCQGGLEAHRVTAGQCE